MSKPDNHLYEFGHFRLDPSQRLLLRAEEHIRLSPKIFDLLLFLVQRSGQLVKKEEIIDHVWSESFVEEANLTNSVSILRKVLGDTGNERTYIETVPKHGYRFVANVKVLDGAGTETPHEEGTAFSAGPTDHAAGGSSVEEEAYVPAAPHSKHHATRKFEALLFASVILVLVVAAFYFWQKRIPTPAAPASAPSVISIAVLPFKPLDAKSGYPSLEIGMTDSIITRLSDAGQVTVLPLSAVRRYTDPHEDAIKAGRELGVESVLDGSIQRSHDRIRVRVNLVHVSDGQSLWADQFYEKFTDIFTVQDAISERVAAALQLKLRSAETRPLKRRQTENTDAYEAYLRGRYFWNNRGAENLKKAIEQFNRALALDDKYALAFAGLADCYNLLPSYGALPPMEAYPKAKAAAIKALEIDDTIPEAHVALARIKANYDWDWPGAEAHFKRAIQLNPNYSNAHYFYGLNYLVPMGRLDEAAAELRRARELERFSLIINTNLGVIFYYQGRYDQAIEQYRNALELDPRFETARLRLIDVYTETGRYDEALTEQELIVEFKGAENPRYLKQLKMALRQSGFQGYWRKRLEQEKQRAKEKEEYVPSTSMAELAARLGDNEQAFEWLEKAYVERDEWLTRLKLDPHYKSLRADPRYADLLRRINLGP